MLDIHKPAPSTDTKTAFTHSLLPSYIDASHPPSKKLPFRAFASLPHTHSLDLLLPSELWDLVHAHLEDRRLTQRVYARAYLSLSDVLADDFLDAYVRNGSASLLASPLPGSDTAIDIVHGVLRIAMGRAEYERAGLVGRAVEDGGKKHARSRWVVEVDLKSASMRKGKKGFERVRWAAREALGGSRRWLFCSAHPEFAENVRAGREVLSAHAPEIVVLAPTTEERHGVAVPRFDVQANGLSALYESHDALALQEWLDMLALHSPRVNPLDTIDPVLCRYDVPSFSSSGPAIPHNLTRVRWTGFLTPPFIQELFLAVWNAGFKSKRDAKRRKGVVDPDGDVDMSQAQEKEEEEEEEGGDGEKWFSLSAQAFGGRKAWTLMQFAATRETLVWEVEG